MITNISYFITQHSLLPPQATVVLGLSGGPDSVFLLYVLHHLRTEGKIQRIIAAHLDHQWRPNSSNDTVFCKNLAYNYDVEFVSTTWQKLNLSHLPKGSKEEQGRFARRHFLSTIADEYGAHVIALAHHRDDQQETFFIRLLRGASLSGLVGMRPKHGRYIRPLLQCAKADIILFLEQHSIPYLVDPSNTSPEFLRNRIRMTVIPALRSCDERFDKSFERTLHSLQETESFLEHVTRTTFQQLAEKRNGYYYLNTQKLLTQHPALLQRLLVHWFIQENVQFPVSKGFFAEVIKFLKSGSGSHALHEAWKMVKEKDFVFIQKITQ